MALPSTLAEFRAMFFRKNLPQAEYKLIKKTESRQDDGAFHDSRLNSLKQSTRVKSGKIKASILESYNPNPGQNMSPEDYQLAKESLKNEPYLRAYREHVLSILNPTPTPYESQASFRYDSLASEECDAPKPEQISDETWAFITNVYDDITCDPAPCPDGQVQDCEGVCDGGKTFDCLGICGGTATTDSLGNCCEPEEIGCSGKCSSESGPSWERDDECCQLVNAECIQCTNESGEKITLCPEHPKPGDNNPTGGGGGGGGTTPTKICKGMYFPPSNVFKKEGKAVKITFESVPELNGTYIPESNLADSWVLNGDGINKARIEARISFEGTCLIHWEFSFKTKNGELVDIDSEEGQWDRKMLVLSKNFSVSFPQAILQSLVGQVQALIEGGALEQEFNNVANKFREYFDFWPDKTNVLDFSLDNTSAPDSLTDALYFVTNTLSDAYETQESKIRAEVIDYNYNVPSDDTSSEFCATSLSGGRTAFHWQAPLRMDQTGWKIVINTSGVDINHDVSADRCGYTVTRDNSWQQIKLMRHYSNDSTDLVKTLQVSDIDSCLESTICPSSDTKLIQKKLSFQWSCNTVFNPSETVTVDFSIDKNAPEDYVDVKVLSSSTEYCNGADNIYFQNVKILDDSSAIEVDYTSQAEKYKYFKNDAQSNESSTFEVWLRIKHPTIADGEFEDFVAIQPPPTPTETQTQTETNFQSSSLGNFKFYAMKEDLGHLETCSAGYFVLSLKKYNENNFVQQGTNKIFTSGSSGSNIYDVPFLTLGDEGSEIAIDAGDTIKLRYRAIPPSGNPYLGTGCYSFYEKPNKISIEHGNVEDTGATTNPVITGWSKSAELDNSSSEAFIDFEYTFSESDGDKLTWCAVMKSTPITDFKVSGGASESPFYNFTFQHPYGNEITASSLRLVPGLTYTFTADGISTHHPFSIGPSYGNTSLGWVSGSALTGSSGTITVNVPSDYSGDLYYFCGHHSSMISEIQILN